MNHALASELIDSICGFFAVDFLFGLCDGLLDNFNVGSAFVCEGWVGGTLSERANFGTVSCGVDMVIGTSSSSVRPATSNVR
jgi:hypothetical protein